LLHLVGFSFVNCTVMHGSMNVIAFACTLYVRHSWILSQPVLRSTE